MKTKKFFKRIKKIIRSKIEVSPNSWNLNSTTLPFEAVEAKWLPGPFVSFEKNKLLKKLSSDQLREVESIFQDKHFQQGERIISEGEKGDCLYLIESGVVAIKKDNILLAKKKAGDHFGAMALIDNSPRSADVIALSDVSVKSVSIEEIQIKDVLLLQILRNHINENQKKLRKTNELAVAEIKMKLKEFERRNNFGQFFLTILGLLIFYQFALGVFLEFGEVIRNRFYLLFITPALIILLGGITFFYALKSPFPISFFGVSLKNWKPHLLQSLKWTAVFIAVITLLKWILIQTIPAYSHKALFDLKHFQEVDWRLLVLSYVVYLFLAPVQEFLTRGILQGGLQHFLTGKWKTTKAILISNLIFSSFHLFLSGSLAIATFLPGLFWGLLYSRQGTLLGVSVSHVLIGLYVLALLRI